MIVSKSIKSLVMFTIVVIIIYGQSRSEEPRKTHSFTWRYEANDAVMFLFDGAELGRGNSGAAKSRVMSLGTADLVKVIFPKEEEPKSEKLVLPCARNGVIEAWLDKGVTLEFRCGEHKFDSIFVSWTCQAYDKPTALVINGQTAGSIMDADTALEKLKITEENIVIFMYPFMDDGSFSGDEFPKKLKDAYSRWLFKKNAKGVLLLKRSIWTFPEGTPFLPNQPCIPPGMRKN